MRRIRLPILLVVLGAFLVSGGVIGFVLTPRWVVPAPAAYLSGVQAGTGTFYDFGTQRERAGALRLRVAAQPNFESTGSRILAWNVYRTLSGPGGVFIDTTTDSIVFDRLTGRSIRCCGEAVDGVATTHSGYLYRFPRASGHGTYEIWNPFAARALPSSYTGSVTSGGRRLSRFTQTAPSMKIGTRRLAAGSVGAAGAGTVLANVYYSGTSTALVDPASGVIVAKQDRVLISAQAQSHDGAVLTILDARLNSTAQTRERLLGLTQGLSNRTAVTRWIVLGAGVVIGLSLLVLGLRSQLAAPAE